jgi:hypothetical protein
MPRASFLFCFCHWVFSLELRFISDFEFRMSNLCLMAGEVGRVERRSVSRQACLVYRPEVALDRAPATNAKLNVMLGGDAAAREQFTSLGERRSHRVERAQPAVSPRLVHRVDDRAVQRPKQNSSPISLFLGGAMPRRLCAARRSSYASGERIVREDRIHDWVSGTVWPTAGHSSPEFQPGSETSGLPRDPAASCVAPSRPCGVP